MFNGKKRKKFMDDFNLINRKLDERTPTYMITNGLSVFNKKVSVLFKITKDSGTVDCNINLGDITTVAKIYHKFNDVDEFTNWIILSAMEYGNNTK